MKRMIVLGVALFAMVGAGEPATKPTTQVAAAETFPAMQKRLAELVRENAELKEQLAAVTKERDALIAANPPKPEAGEKPATFAAAKQILIQYLKVGVKRDAVRKMMGDPDDTTRKGDSIVETYKWVEGWKEKTIRCTYSDEGVLFDAREFEQQIP